MTNDTSRFLVKPAIKKIEGGEKCVVNIILIYGNPILLKMQSSTMKYARKR